MDTWSQANGAGFFQHRAGRVGVSVSGCAFNCNLVQPPQSLIKTICYLHLFKINTKATQHDCKHEDNAIKAYESEIKGTHVKSSTDKVWTFHK